VVGLLTHIRIAILVVEAEDRLARGKPNECWSMLEKVADLYGSTWPIKGLPGYVNLQAAVAALYVGRTDIARECASVAERVYRNNEQLPAADVTYLTYYAVMISRSAQAQEEKILPPSSQFYPALTEADVAQVNSRWRRKFPLVQVSPEDVP
jgi:hypothetical protein